MNVERTSKNEQMPNTNRLHCKRAHLPLCTQSANFHTQGPSRKKPVDNLLPSKLLTETPPGTDKCTESSRYQARTVSMTDGAFILVATIPEAGGFQPSTAYTLRSHCCPKSNSTMHTHCPRNTFDLTVQQQIRLSKQDTIPLHTTSKSQLSNFSEINSTDVQGCTGR